MSISAKDVAPKMWTSIIVLFDNGKYSVISGDCGDGEIRRPSLGERWNGEWSDDSNGYPVQGENPTWYCPAAFLEVPILHGLLDELARNPGSQQNGTAKERVRLIYAELAKRYDDPSIVEDDS
jgi:hypothetical protein